MVYCAASFVKIVLPEIKMTNSIKKVEPRNHLKKRGETEKPDE